MHLALEHFFDCRRELRIIGLQIHIQLEKLILGQLAGSFLKSKFNLYIYFEVFYKTAKEICVESMENIVALLNAAEHKGPSQCIGLN